MTTQEILEAARGAKAALALADSAARAQALHSMAAQLCSPDSMTAILAANADDMAAAKGHISEVMLDRLALTEERTGGMATKLRAARMVTGSGADMVIANGAHPELLYDIAAGKPIGTRFAGHKQPALSTQEV